MKQSAPRRGSWVGRWESRLPGDGAHDRLGEGALPEGHREVWEGLGHLGVLAGPAWWGRWQGPSCTCPGTPDAMSWAPWLPASLSVTSVHREDF